MAHLTGTGAWVSLVLSFVYAAPTSIVFPTNASPPTSLIWLFMPPACVLAFHEHAKRGFISQALRITEQLACGGAQKP
eukprot:1136988-Pelagomonas_calceolata.AAC.7